jgi:transposase
MKASSQDVRQRVLKAVDAGHRQAEVAKTFAVTVATIKRSLKQGYFAQDGCCPQEVSL